MTRFGVGNLEDCSDDVGVNMPVGDGVRIPEGDGVNIPQAPGESRSRDIGSFPRPVPKEKEGSNIGLFNTLDRGVKIGVPGEESWSVY